MSGAGVRSPLVLPSQTLAAVELSDGMTPMPEVEGAAEVEADVDPDVALVLFVIRLIGLAPPGLRGPIGRGDVAPFPLPPRGEPGVGDVGVGEYLDGDVPPVGMV